GGRGGRHRQADGPRGHRRAADHARALRVGGPHRTAGLTRADPRGRALPALRRGSAPAPPRKTAVGTGSASPPPPPPPPPPRAASPVRRPGAPPGAAGSGGARARNRCSGERPGRGRKTPPVLTGP